VEFHNQTSIAETSAEPYLLGTHTNTVCTPYPFSLDTNEPVRVKSPMSKVCI
jgi:hypothetical protein